MYDDYLNAFGNRYYKNGNNIKNIVTINNETVCCTYELTPITQKSFYGKARVLETETKKYLISYDTIICSFSKNNIFIPYWIDYSNTTMKHINSFMKLIGYRGFTKKEWLNLEYKKEYDITKRSDFY